MRRRISGAGSTGFTIVELVVVIILLGILAATALPRFIDVDKDARLQTARNAMGSFQEAINIAHGKWLAAGGNAVSLVIDGITLPFDNQGWPKSQVSDNADCIAVWNAVFHAPEAMVPFVAGTAQDAWSTIGFGTGCLYMYQYGKAFSGSEPLPFFIYLPGTTAAQILPFNM